jgi:hypothetical protein
VNLALDASINQLSVSQSERINSYESYSATEQSQYEERRFAPHPLDAARDCDDP